MRRGGFSGWAVALLALVFSVPGHAEEISRAELDDLLLTPAYSEVGTGHAVTLTIDCLPKASLADCSVAYLFAEAVDWQVNGVSGGSSEVGTIAGKGMQATYTAPHTAPRGNPVSVTATLRSGGKQRLQLAAQVFVVEPAQWQGKVSIGFCGLFDSRTEEKPMNSSSPHSAYRFATHDDCQQQLGTRGAAPAEGDANSETVKVKLAAQYGVRSTLVDSRADDGSGLVMLEVGIPTLEYDFEHRVIDRCLGYSVTTLVGEIDFDNYQGQLPTVPVTLNADRTSALGYVPSPIMTVRGSTVAADCQGAGMGAAIETQPEMIELPSGLELTSNGSGSMSIDPGNGQPVRITARSFAVEQRLRSGGVRSKTYEGSVTRETTLRIRGHDVPGVLTVTWSLSHR